MLNEQSCIGERCSEQFWRCLISPVHAASGSAIFSRGLSHDSKLLLAALDPGHHHPAS